MYIFLQLQSDCAKIINSCKEEKSIPENIAQNFQTVFLTRWPELAEGICKLGSTVNTQDLKEFKNNNKEHIDNGTYLMFKEI